MNMRLILLTFLLSVFVKQQALKSQTVIYIDPTFTGTPKNGSVSNPFSTIPTITDNSIYLFKAGTIYNLASTISVTANSVSFGSYGTGDNPVIVNPDYSKRTIIFTGSGNCSIKGLSFIVPSHAPATDDAGTGNICFVNNAALKLTIEDCYIKGGNPAVNGYKCSSVKVLNSHITKATYDSYYSEFVDSVFLIIPSSIVRI